MYIGIDPSFRQKGFAVCIMDDTIAKFIVFNSFLDFLKWVYEFRYDSKIWIGIENSNMQNVTFDMNGNKNVIAKMSRDAGKNQAISQATVDVCRVVFGTENVLEISPEQKGAKIPNNIFDAIVRQDKMVLENYKGLKSEQDKRDAYMIAQRAKAFSKFRK